MTINLSAETINTVYAALKAQEHGFKYWLEVSLPNKKANPDKKEEMENKLAKVKDALQVFEELLNN